MSTSPAAAGVREFDELIAAVRDGSEDAAWELVQRYSGKIRRTVRRFLPEEMRSKFDSLDFVQQTWHSIFQNAERLATFDRHEEFVGFLAGVATNKVKMEIRRRTGARYNVNLEQSLEETAEYAGSELAGGDPTPSQVAVARDRWNHLMLNQPEHYRQILQLRLSGSTISEIAMELDLHEITVQRALRKMTIAF